MTPNTSAMPPRPYAMLGAGQIVSALWKDGDERSGWSYRFNIYRSNPSSGKVSQLLRPGDVKDLAKLCQVLAAVLADDGCLPDSQRRELAQLAQQLDVITAARS